MDNGGVADWELEDSSGAWSAGAVHGNAVLAVSTGKISQVLGCFASAGQGEGALGGGCRLEPRHVVWVVTCFSPDGLEFRF